MDAWSLYVYTIYRTLPYFCRDSRHGAYVYSKTNMLPPASPRRRHSRGRCPSDWGRPDIVFLFYGNPAYKPYYYDAHIHARHDGARTFELD